MTVNKSIRICLSTFVLLTMLFAGMPAPRAHAAETWTVTNAADTDDGLCDSHCTLREAINSAGSGYTINFSRNQTITLCSPLPSIYQRLTIKGKGAANTIVQDSVCNPVTLAPSGPATYRVFEVGTEGRLTLRVSSSTFHGNSAYGGGGINNLGTLEVTWS